MSLLGESSLQHLHVVLAGQRSVGRSRQVAPFESAVQTARTILTDIITEGSVQGAVYDYLSDAAHCSFEIDPKTLQFSPIYGPGLDPNIMMAEKTLREGLPRHRHGLTVANPDKDLIVELNREFRVPIRMRGFSFPEVRQHQNQDRPRQEITVKFSELIDLARSLDTEDREANRPTEDWESRMAAINLQATTGSGLQDSDVFDLTGLKHLIGLPGSGKTTLISLLCVLLKRRGQRVAVFFTSIETAREYLERLQRYGVKVAILMGRSTQTHRRHVNRMAELLAGQGNGGFGHSQIGTELFATCCPLPAFADSWPEKWELGEAPCESIYEAGSDERKLCPAWELCGRVKNQRELVTADVWLGHILSADTYVPAHTSSERQRYFEFIAEQFDLAVIDECDETQKVLDEHGALTLKLTGDDDSQHIAIQRLTSQLAANRIRVSDDMLRYMLQANEFERHMLRFLRRIRLMFQDKRTSKFASSYSDKLLTANFLIRESLIAAGTNDKFNTKALSALSDFWERAMYRAFFFRGDDEFGWPKAEKYANDLDLEVKDANERWLRVNRALKRYLAQDHASTADEVLDEIVQELALLFQSPSADLVRDQVRLLVTVGFTIASYQRLTRSARPLAQRGEIPDELVLSRTSPEIRELVPRSILGTFSAVRYRRSPDKDGFEIDYVAMDAAPRVLMHRLHELGRVNVLLSSATSWMKPSTEYHVEKKPDYVLSPATNEVGIVRLYVSPQYHPSTKKPLRFSGGGGERDENLRHMVTALAQPDVDGLSELERAVRSVATTLGKKRMAALAVNSYDQVQAVVEQINDVNPELGLRTRGVVRELPSDGTRVRYILRGHVESLGASDNIDVLVFPIASLGRGVNIVIRSSDEDNGKAAVGSVFFLTRPHPAAGDLGLMLSLLSHATHALDREDFRELSLTEARRVYDVERYRIYKRVANLLARPMSASRLDRDTLFNFAANLLVPILQTVGRGMRKRMPVSVYFVDAAWAPHSAEGKPETDRSSILVVMQRVLEECFTDPDPDIRDIYQALYGVFREAFNDIQGLHPPRDAPRSSSAMFNPCSVSSETDLDGYDPDAQRDEDDEPVSVFTSFVDEDEFSEEGEVI